MAEYKKLIVQHYILSIIYLCLSIFIATFPLLEKIETLQIVHFERPKWIDCVDYQHELLLNSNIMELKEIRKFCMDINLTNIYFFPEIQYLKLDLRWFLFLISL